MTNANTNPQTTSSELSSTSSQEPAHSTHSGAQAGEAPEKLEQSILIIDDDAGIVDLMSMIATDLKFKPVVAPTALQGIQMAKALIPDLIFLDIRMPDMDGFQVCRQLRTLSETRNIPVLMITAQTDIDSKVRGLELGADDYLTKPFFPREVAARVRALLRRSRTTRFEVDDLSPLELGNLKVDPQAHLATLGTQSLNLTQTEQKILLRLLRNMNEVLEKRLFLKDVWGATNVTVRTIDTHVANLRRKLRGWTHAIETIHGVGYIVRSGSLADTPLASSGSDF